MAGSSSRLIRRTDLGLQQPNHPLGRTNIAAVGKQQAALHVQGHRFGQRLHDLRPELARAHTQRKHFIPRALQLGHGAEHAGSRPARGQRARFRTRVGT
jgi:hypothetical protein